MGSYMNELVTPILGVEPGASKEELLESLLFGKIAKGLWAVGDRLPPERTLASDFNVSRSTLRGALRRLEAKGLLVSRQGSGYYLKSTYLLNGPTATPLQESDSRIMARLEAAYLFLPGVASIAAVNMTTTHLAELEHCTIALSRAIFKEDIREFKKQARLFFQIIAASTDNPVIEEVVSSFCASSSLMFPGFFSFGEVQQKKLFADYVLIFNALKKRDVSQVEYSVRKKVVNVCLAFADLKQLELPQTIRKVMPEM